MKFFPALLLILVISTARGQDITPIQSGANYYMFRVEKVVFIGTIAERNDSTIILKSQIGTVFIPLRDTVSLKLLEADQRYRINGHNGEIFIGKLKSVNDEALSLESDNHIEIAVRMSLIKNIEAIDKTNFVKGKYYFTNRLSSRYFYAPSGIPLEDDENYYHNIYVLYNGFQVKVTKWMSLGGAVLVPFAVTGTINTHFKIAKNIHAGIGFVITTTIILENNYLGGVGYANITAGNKSNNISLKAGMGADKDLGVFSNIYDGDIRYTEKPFFSLAGMLRLSPKMYVVSENYLIYREESQEHYFLNTDSKLRPTFSLGLRFLDRVGNAIDFGVIEAGGNSNVLPVIGYSRLFNR